MTIKSFQHLIERKEMVMGPKGTDSGLEGSKDKKHKSDKYEQWLQFHHTCVVKEEVKVFKLSSRYLAS